MNTIDDMPVNQAIELYYEKHDAMRKGDMQRLIALKKQHPGIFNKEMDKQVYDIIVYAKEFQSSARYKELRKMMLQEQITVIEKDPV